MTSKRDGANRCTIIGMTGASGSGKSEAAKILAQLGAKIIDADAVAHAIVEEHEVLSELTDEFGDCVVNDQGGFNRAYMSQQAFSDKVFLERLTKITHKYIIKEIMGRIDELILKSGDVKLIIVIDAPIPVEHGFIDLSDIIWVIKSPRALRLQRVIARDCIDAAAAEARFSSQIPDIEYEKLADYLIDNNGSIEDLEKKIKRLYERII